VGVGISLCLMKRDPRRKISPVNCAKLALGVGHLRATDKEFKKSLRTGFGKDSFLACWSHHEVNNARLVRHAPGHAGKHTRKSQKGSS
jgi:hypothetical protein